LEDLNEINRLDDLATCISSNNSYISVKDGFVADTNSNLAVGIAPTDALQASAFREDMIPPIVTGFDLNMDSGALTLYFSETVNSTSFIVSAFGLQSATFSGCLRSYQLLPAHAR